MATLSGRPVAVLLVLLFLGSLFPFQSSGATYLDEGRGGGSDNVEITWQGAPAPGNAMDVDVSGDYVFIAASSGLLIVNISNADELSETAFIDLPGAIGAIAGLEAPIDRLHELCVMSRALAEWPSEPRVETGSGDTQNPAHPADRPDMPMLRNEGESHVASRAKYAAAFVGKTVPRTVF